MTSTTDSFSLPRWRPFTVREIQATPEDGNRYELIDGMLAVCPAVGVAHQVAVLATAVLLHNARPPGIDVIAGPIAVQPNELTYLQPDVIVAREQDFTEENLPVAPLLVVEVTTPNSALNDFNNKKAVYERMGAPSYWLVDPSTPRLTVFELDGAGRYRLAAEVVGKQVFEAVQPFAVRVVPEDLLDRLPAHLRG